MENLKKVNSIIIHHSQRDLDSLERIRDLHVNKYNWEDVGYHWLIDKQGEILKGRDEKFQGAHVFGHNKHSIAICLIGNLDQNPPTKEQIQTLIKILKKKMHEHQIQIENVLRHRDFSNVNKTCPGKFFDMKKVKEQLNKQT